MKTQGANVKTTNEGHLIALLVSSLMITTVLFYLDEGYYNFNWMGNPGNWMMFILYSGIFFSCQVLVSKFIFKRHLGMNNTISSILVGGVTVAILIIIFAMFA